MSQTAEDIVGFSIQVGETPPPNDNWLIAVIAAIALISIGLGAFALKKR